jgi:hypothetical protein
METTRPKGLAIAAGLLVGAGSFLVARPAVEPARAWFAAGQNAVVWSVAVGVLLAVIDDLPVDEDDSAFRSYEDAKWDGFIGLFGSVAVGGVVFLLPLGTSVNYQVVLATFVAGAFLGALAGGIGLALHHVDRYGRSTVEAGGSVPADD